jgi:hypothetical protein
MMKKTLFLMVSTVVILLSGCAGSGHGLFRTNGAGNALANPPFPSALRNADNRGVCLPLSKRLSLNIDVECILDYVQGESPVEPVYLQNDFMNPWIRWNVNF